MLRPIYHFTVLYTTRLIADLKEKNVIDRGEYKAEINTVKAEEIMIEDERNLW